jgi:hypothetical protein
VKITLRDVRPPVWRRLVVPTNATLSLLHAAIQVAMGWDGYHMHAFRRRDVSYGDRKQFQGDPSVGDEAKATLADLLADGWDRFVYEYDFGDNWQHDVLVEGDGSAEGASLLCLDGRRACPPEDVGGPWGYAEHLAILGDPAHEGHAELLECRGPHDPETFSVDAVNARLRSLRAPGRRGPRRR